MRISVSARLPTGRLLGRYAECDDLAGLALYLPNAQGKVSELLGRGRLTSDALAVEYGAP